MKIIWRIFWFPIVFFSIQQTTLAAAELVVLTPGQLRGGGDDVNIVVGTSEDGRTAQFSVVLRSEPAAEQVEVQLSLDDDGTEGRLVSPSDGMLVFARESWNVPQEVIIAGLDDSVADGAQRYTVMGTLNNSAEPIVVVEVINADNETVAINVVPDQGLQTDEDGTAAQFNVSLASEPAADVSIAVVSGDHQ